MEAPMENKAQQKHLASFVTLPSHWAELDSKHRVSEVEKQFWRSVV